MPKFIVLLLVGVLILSACGTTTPVVPAEIPKLDSADTATSIPTDLPAFTRTPIPSSPTPPPTISPAQIDRPAFLAWPLPPSIGTARISQYPNSAWSWHYLGLNDGYECPPMFGYLLNLDSLSYWRDVAIPEEQDMALADPHQFEMVECYSPHAGTDIKAPAGTPVYAVADGKVMEWSVPGLNSYLVLKHCLGGSWDDGGQCVGGKLWYTTYMHIIPDQGLLQDNFEIVQGAQMGTIYDQTINSHLHFEVGIGERSYATYVNPWGQDDAPWLECMWTDQSLCVNPASDYKRLAFYTSDERLFIHQGDLDPIEVPHSQGIQQIRLWGDRVGVLDAENGLLLRDGKYDRLSSSDDLQDWQIVVEGILDFQITDHCIVALDGDGKLWIKESGAEDAWVLLAENVHAFSVSDYRIGYLTGDGDLLVKEGWLENEWVTIQKNVLAFQVINNRIAYVDQQGNLYVNEGEMLSEFELIAEGVRAFQLTDLRLGIIDREDNLLVMEGNLRADWVLQAENVQSFQLADYRILMQGQDGSFKLKEGNLYQEWSDLPYDNLKWVFLNRNMPVEVP